MNIIEIASEILSNKKTHRILTILIVFFIIGSIFIVIFYGPSKYKSIKQGQEIENIENDSLILNRLPHKSGFYSIKYDYDSNHYPIIKIYSSIPLQRKNALDWMEGVEPGSTAKYKIIFEDLKNNPFKESLNE